MKLLALQSSGTLSIVFSPFLAAIFNFCIKCKNTFILEMVQDRAILTKYLAHRVYTESSGTSFFPAIFFCRPVEFLHK